MARNYIGSPVKRKEDVRFLTGTAQYVADVKLPDMLHAAVLRSPHAHARITSIDASEALELPGVHGVYTFDDIAPLAKPIPVRVFHLPGLEDFLQHHLAGDKVRYVGEPVAVVVAESRYLAEDALEAIQVDYEPLPAVTGVRQSLEDRILLHEQNGSNLAGHAVVSFGDIDAVFLNADYTRKEEFSTHRHTGNPLETRGLVADYNAQTGDLTVWGPTKVPHTVKNVLVDQLGLSADRVHLIEPDVGGGFGIRGEFYPEDFLIPFAAMRLGRPVKWIEDRLEHLISANHSRELLCEVEIAANNDGTLLGLRADIYGDMGGYVRTHGAVVPALAAGLLIGPYHVPAFQAAVNCVMTNKVGTGTYRGPGLYEGCFIRERLMDLVAGDLGLDPLELRRRNLIQPSEMPFTVGPTRIDGVITVYDSGDYPSALDRMLQELDYDNLAPLQGQVRDGKYHGVGIACYVEPTGFGPYEGARLVVSDAAQIDLYLGITSLGQGHETVMAQICADNLDLSIESIQVFHGDTDYLPRSIGTFGSRGTVMAGNAILLACNSLKDRILDVAAGYLDTESSSLEFRSGAVYRLGQTGEEPALALAEVVRLAQSGQSEDGTAGLDVTEYFRMGDRTYSYGAHGAHVAVDPETGKLDILKYVVVEDVGRCINPLTMHGQSIGGAAQGIGGTILEELVYDEDGQLLTGTLMDYLLPTSRDIPNIESVILEEAPSPLNPLGVKGAGEGSILATGAALSNAVSHALRSFQVNVTQLPLSPNRIRDLIRNTPPP